MNQEILRLVDTIHRDKEIDKELVFQALEAAYLSAVKKKLGESEEFRVIIDRLSGDYRVFHGEKEIHVPDLGRIAASAGKQVLLQKIREAERDVIYDEYIGKAGKLVSGVVQRFEGPNIIVNLGKVEGILPKSEQAPGERFRTGERIKVLIKDIKKNTNRVKITLSRTSPEMVRALFSLEVPEIADKVIEIVEIAREPGYRTKVAVTTYDHNVDCVGACVGVRGSRIKNIVDELFGEKIDIVRWNESIEVLIMNALKPAEISSMDLDFEAKKAKVYVKPEQQSLAIGKRGQNVRLASRLCGWDLDIVTVSEEELEKLREEDLPLPSPLDPPEGTLSEVAKGEAKAGVAVVGGQDGEGTLAAADDGRGGDGRGGDVPSPLDPPEGTPSPLDPPEGTPSPLDPPEGTLAIREAEAGEAEAGEAEAGEAEAGEAEAGEAEAGEAEAGEAVAGGESESGGAEAGGEAEAGEAGAGAGAVTEEQTEEQEAAERDPIMAVDRRRRGMDSAIPPGVVEGEAIPSRALEAVSPRTGKGAQRKRGPRDGETAAPDPTAAADEAMPEETEHEEATPGKTAPRDAGASSLEDSPRKGGQ